jgi:uracil DNA glycosylase
MKYCSNVSIAIQVEKAQESAEETVTYQHFKLTVMQGEFTDSQIVVIAWGEGNREFIKMLVHLSRHHLPSIFTFSLASHQEFWNKYKKVQIYNKWKLCPHVWHYIP